MHNVVKIKICGLTTAADIAAVNYVRPDFVGLVFAPGRRMVTPERAAALRRALAPEILAIGVFVDAPLSLVAELLKAKVIDGAQLHGQENPAYLQALRTAVRAPLIKAIRVGVDPEENAAQVTAAVAGGADYLLFDHGAGGSGQTFDWRRLPASPLPFFLAGGLNPENIPAAIAATQPFAVDLSSGVETARRKDAAKITAAVAAVRDFRPAGEKILQGNF